jgi:gliding motility-associated-like protein
MGGPKDDWAQSIALDASGNIYTTGYFFDTADFDPGSSTFNLVAFGSNSTIFVSKLNSSGDFTWAVRIGNTSPYPSFGRSITTDASGNVYATGAFEGKVDFDPGAGEYNLITAGDDDAFILKLDASGNFIWAGSMGYVNSGDDSGFSIHVDGTGKIYTAGVFRGTADFDPGSCIFNLVSITPAAGFVQKLSTSSNASHTITNFTPASGPIGTTVTITGTNFSTTPANNMVQFNNISATVTSSSATSITTTVPAGATSGNISVTIGCNTVTSTSSFTVASGQANQPPIILSSTTGVTVGGIVTIDLLPLISDADNNLDSSTLKLVTNESEQGASAIINASSHLILDYGGTEFYGTDMVMIEVCDLEASCTQQELTVQVTGDIVVYNGISPNGDALNATWQIGNIEVFEQTKKNRVTIFNRWGDEVFSTTDYNNADRVFKGITNSGNELPSGTYFYRIKFTSGLQTRTGYLVLKR